MPDARRHGRTKLSWIAATFGISRRAATDARARLIELGWLEPLQAEQWELNRWGVRDIVNVHYAPEASAGSCSDLVEDTDSSSVEEGDDAGGSASPRADFSGGSASPSKQVASSSRNLETRRLGASAPGPSGDSRNPEEGRAVPRTRSVRSSASRGKPSIRDIRLDDLQDPEAIEELRRQAIGCGFAFGGEAGELDFFALANRARSRGSNPPALFFDLISNHRTAFITIADEEAARAQLGELREGPPPVRELGGGGEVLASVQSRQLSEEEAIVEKCIRVAKGLRGMDPFKVAQRVKGWTRTQWDEAHLRYQTAQIQRCGGSLETGALR